MPRNGSGTMTVSNSFSPDTTILSSEANENFSDFASEITNSLAKDGQTTMTGQFKAASGTVAAPGITFGSDLDCGFYRIGGDNIGAAAGGALIFDWSTTALTVASGINLYLGTSKVVAIPTGAMFDYLATTAPTGWVRANGRTIGNASSGATERANADTSDLFTFLWTNFSDSICAVSSGRGASAAADYAANKTIALPDLRARVTAGLDDMGNSAAGRVTSTTMSPDGTTNGASGGTQTHVLTEAQLPSHTHTGTTASNGAHTHTVSLDGGGNFASGGVSGARQSGTTPTSSDGAHTHTFTSDATGSGAAHLNMQPTWLCTKIIKL